MVRLLVTLLLVVPFAAAASDDGFVWIDANTRIKLTPLKAGSAAAGDTKAPEPKKAEKKEEPKK